jgi:hypothetical protein
MLEWFFAAPSARNRKLKPTPFHAPKRQKKAERAVTPPPLLADDDGDDDDGNLLRCLALELEGPLANQQDALHAAIPMSIVSEREWNEVMAGVLWISLLVDILAAKRTLHVLRAFLLDRCDAVDLVAAYQDA